MKLRSKKLLLLLLTRANISKDVLIAQCDTGEREREGTDFSKQLFMPMSL